MIIQCEQCSTKFRLDDAKVTDKGVKVRCAKCRHVFTVRKEQSDQEAQPDFGALLDQSAADTALFTAPQADSAGYEPQTSFDSSSSRDERAVQVFSVDTASSQDIPPQPSPFALAGEDDFSFSNQEETPGFAAEQSGAATPAGTAEFPGFDSGDTVAEGGVGTASPFDASEPAGFDFGDENPFGDMVAAPSAEKAAESVGYDVPMDDGAVTMETGATSTPETEADAAAKVTIDEPFSLGEIDFGDESTGSVGYQVAAEEVALAQELPASASARAQDAGKDGLGKEPVSTAVQEELPPLSIASRRKQSPLFTGLVALLVAAVVALLAYVGNSMFFAEKVAKENGRITVRAVNASFVRNVGAGDILVITGEAVNEFTKPRAAIQLKGVMYGSSGQVLASKNAYAGNPLTKEQLASMPLDKIEASMANQFGDSLANLEVAPGKTIPFVIAIANPPADAKDYGVEVAGSTVATGKQ